MTAEQQIMLQLFSLCGIIATCLFVVHSVAAYRRRQATLRANNDKIVQALLDEMRVQRLRELEESGLFNHPSPAGRKIINVDFTEAPRERHSQPASPARTSLKYKLVYDERLGIYRKMPR